MSPVGQPFECGVNPSEAEGFLNDIEVRKRVGLRRLRPVAGYPTTAFRKMVPFKPLPQLSAIGEGQEACYFHGLCFDFIDKLEFTCFYSPILNGLETISHYAHLRLQFVEDEQ